MGSPKRTSSWPRSATVSSRSEAPLGERSRNPRSRAGRCGARDEAPAAALRGPGAGGVWWGRGLKVLRLKVATPADWARRAAESIDVVLLDHCHLEKKAASTALTLIFRYPEHPQLARPLSELAREELEHFELVLGHLEARGVPYAKLRPAPYAGKLMSIVRAEEPSRLLDTLLVCAFIEARSCERMKHLAEVLDGPLGEMYADLLASEARHHALYVDLARDIFGRSAVDARLPDVADHEARVVTDAPREPRLHNA